MNIIKAHIHSTVVWVISGIILMMACGLVHADTCQIIRIEQGRGGSGARLEIIPEKLSVPVGTCTVWINWVMSQEVRVSFRENAKQCIASTISASGFKEEELNDGESCYITDSLPRGKTASLVWNKPGVYKYTLEAPQSTVQGGVGLSGVMSEGVIEVK